IAMDCVAINLVVGGVRLMANVAKLVQRDARTFSNTMRNWSTNTQRRRRENVRASVIPSPVGDAMVNDVCPSPPSPRPARLDAFLTKIDVLMVRAIACRLAMLREYMTAVWQKPFSTALAAAMASGASFTWTRGITGILR